MSAFPVSVVVVSQNRPELLRRCLIALGQLDYPVFEVIVVACASGTAIARTVTVGRDLAVVEFDGANISAARNIGISHARGEVVAFIDDDAVPEPTWLTHLSAVFEDTAVAQAGGTTLGRNGISVQHGAAVADRCGVTLPVAILSDAPVRVVADGDRAPRLHGTNMALRRDALVRVGGFDERFRFYLDETDLGRRVSEAGGGTCFVPRAVVHHTSGASTMRRADRVPRSLFEIGASCAVFHRKHAHPGLWEQAQDAVSAERRTWLLRHMQRGTLTPDDVARLLGEFRRGYAEGSTRAYAISPAMDTFRSGDIPKVSMGDRQDIYLVATPLTRCAILRQAEDRVAGGQRVTVFDFTLTALFHRVRYTDAGYWHHTGGVYGRELRSEPILQHGTRDGRVRRALNRVCNIRSHQDMVRKT